MIIIRSVLQSLDAPSNSNNVAMVPHGLTALIVFPERQVFEIPNLAKVAEKNLEV